MFGKCWFGRLYWRPISGNYRSKKKHNVGLLAPFSDQGTHSRSLQSTAIELIMYIFFFDRALSLMLACSEDSIAGCSWSSKPRWGTGLRTLSTGITESVYCGWGCVWKRNFKLGLFQLVSTPLAYCAAWIRRKMITTCTLQYSSTFLLQFTKDNHRCTNGICIPYSRGSNDSADRYSSLSVHGSQLKQQANLALTMEDTKLRQNMEGHFKMRVNQEQNHITECQSLG